MHGIARGMLAGLVGLMAMRAARQTAGRLLRPLQKREAREARRRWLRSGRQLQLPRVLPNAEDAASTRLATRGYALVMGKRPSAAQVRVLRSSVHGSFGLTMGAAYSLWHEPEAARRALVHGASFGVLLWALGDEVLAPLMGLSAPPLDYPLCAHALTLAGHLGYGTATALALWTMEGDGKAHVDSDQSAQASHEHMAPTPP